MLDRYFLELYSLEYTSVASKDPDEMGDAERDILKLDRYVVQEWKDTNDKTDFLSDWFGSPMFAGDPRYPDSVTRLLKLANILQYEDSEQIATSIYQWMSSVQSRELQSAVAYLKQNLAQKYPSWGKVYPAIEGLIVLIQQK